jgi:recombination protein RecT
MTDTAVATVETRDTRPPMVVLRDRLQAREGELKAALGPDIPVPTFIRAVMTSVALNQDILACTWQSIWNACLKACRDGLIPDGVDAAIVPFKNTATYIPMYQGMLRRFRRSGQFKWITANLVREGEEFIHYIDENGEHFRHVPGGNFSAPIVKIYSLATTRDGGVFVAVLPIAEANKIRNMSRTTREDSPWKQWPEEMYKKTALRRLSKYLPSARDLLPDEELPEIEAPAAAAELPAAGPAKVSAPAASMDQASAAAGEESGGEQGTEAASESSQDAMADAARNVAARDPAAVVESTDPVAAAYECGRQDRARGMHRRALPGEFRDPSRTREALAWQAGWDGTEPPNFNKGETTQ